MAKFSLSKLAATKDYLRSALEELNHEVIEAEDEWMG